jgi:hypothetical protein
MNKTKIKIGFITISDRAFFCQGVMYAPQKKSKNKITYNPKLAC